MAGSHSAGYDPMASAAALAQNKRAAWIYACAVGGLIGHVCWRCAVDIGGENAVITFYDVGFEGASPYLLFAKRCGWMAVCNAALAFPLVMKNTPLAFLTRYSHERLNVLHRWSGRTIWFYSCLHIYLQSIYQRFYELFYLSHISMFILAVVGMGLHKPKKSALAIIALGPLWCLGRMIRGFQKSDKLPTRLPCLHFHPSYPEIPVAPFTISSVGGVEFVIRAQKGFTLDLHKFALKNSGREVSAYIGGPNGAVPDFERMNRVVLFAEVSGEAFMFPIAVDIVRNVGRIAAGLVEVVWVIRDERMSTKIPDPDHELVASQPAEDAAALENDVRRSLYIEEESPSSPSRKYSATSPVEKKQNFDMDIDIEIVKSKNRTSVLPGRPDLGAIVRGAVTRAEWRDAVGVGACGPTELIRVARNAAAENITVGGPSVLLHCEQFGWG
ncbi:hypothetical protein L873DRAFT_1860210 [Choiromyces venosus 120613-1]|uniref:FAD-binding FR-type domain-containing protein n=1 Tax=Choiromyces venosus 120613-1 TaxID=1336337 RepID=A0A3N4K4S3_9PEZI|nr:hypothetical protein L873DRAFT_1860210 [Choiromyces venosus 120613-1]